MARLVAAAVLIIVVVLAAVAFTRDDGAGSLVSQRTATEVTTVDRATAGRATAGPATAGPGRVDPADGERQAEATTTEPPPTKPTSADTSTTEPTVLDPAASGLATVTDPPQTQTATDEPMRQVIANNGPNPGLADLDGWLQSDVNSLAELGGKVVVVQLWTFGCSNCQATFPNLKALYAQHGSGEGDFEIVGVHAPEFAYEEDPANISAAAAAEGVTWPIALDTRRRNFHDWQPGRSGYWPRTYVLDRQGDIRFDHIGEGAYDELNQTVAALLADPAL